MVLSSLTSSKYWDIGQNDLNWTHLRPNSRLSHKSHKLNEFCDVFTMVQKTSNRHIPAVINNLTFIIQVTWLPETWDFGLTQRFLRLFHKQSLRHVDECNTLRDKTSHRHTQHWSMDWNRGAAACLERYVQRDYAIPLCDVRIVPTIEYCAQLRSMLW